eukprot:Opistho-2@56722
MAEGEGAARVVKDVLAGTAAGIAQVLVGQPFDTIKVRLQCQPVDKPIYSGFFDCVKKTVANEGAGALFKGTLPPLVGIGACVSIQFATVEAVKRYFQDGDKTRRLGYDELYVCGAAAGIANSAIAIPVEHIRIRMQVQRNKPGEAAPYNGSIDCVKKVWNNHGVTGLYRGTLSTLVREFQGYGGYFLVYEWATRNFIPEGKKSTLPILACGAIAGFGYWLPIFPVDVIKSKLQADSLSSPKYSGTVDCIRKTFAEEGIRGFYRGLTPCVLRAIPASASTFLAFEVAMKLLG